MELNLKEFLCESNLSYYQKGATAQIDNFKSLILTYLRKFDDFKEEDVKFKFEDLSSISFGVISGSGDGFIPSIDAYIPTVIYKNQEVDFIGLIYKFSYELPEEKIYLGAIWSYGYFGFDDDDWDYYARELNYKNLEDFKNNNKNSSVLEEWLNVKSKNLLDDNIIVKFFICVE